MAYIILIKTSIVCLICWVVYYIALRYAKYVKRAYHNGQSTIWFHAFSKYNKPKYQQQPQFLQKCKRGDIIVRDFRSKDTILSPTKTLRIVTLNMEMGKKINAIISTLRKLNADIIFLQEVDLSTHRVHYVDIVAELSTELQMNSVFAVEVEIAHIEKDSKSSVGYGGNAILSRYDFISTKGVIIKCGRYPQYMHQSKTHNEAFAVINIPTFGSIGCYSIHLDPHWCGVRGRIKQYHEIIEDVARNKDDVNAFILCGDFNTVCHGLNRLYPSIGCDHESRFGSLGETEAQYFERNAVQKANEKYNLDLYDPFDKVHDYTMFNHRFGYYAKADWCVLSETLKTVKKKVCPESERCSDHQWLLIDVALFNR